MLSLAARNAFPDFKVLQASEPSSGGCACLPVCWAHPPREQDLNSTLALDLCTPAQHVVPLLTIVLHKRGDPSFPSRYNRMSPGTTWWPKYLLNQTSSPGCSSFLFHRQTILSKLEENRLAQVSDRPVHSLGSTWCAQLLITFTAHLILLNLGFLCFISVLKEAQGTPSSSIISGERGRGHFQGPVHPTYEAYLC